MSDQNTHGLKNLARRLGARGIGLALEPISCLDTDTMVPLRAIVSTEDHDV